MSAEQHRQLTDNVQLAMSLGATIVTRESEDVAGALLDFTRSEGISILVVGRPTRGGLIRRFAPGIVDKLLESARGVDIVVVDV
jgi:K+-sensing histidine kinase KdpD